MTKLMRYSLLAVAALAAPLPPAPAQAAASKPEWNQIENVKDAAKRMGELHRRQGSEAALKFLEACYKTHTIAEKYTEGLESCMAQDYMLSQMLAVVYSRVPDEKLKDMKAPTSEIIVRSMRGRFQAIFQQYKLTQPQADSLRDAVDKHGMPIFIKLVFPSTGDGTNGPPEKEKAPVKIPLPQMKLEQNGPPSQAPAGEPK